MWQKLRMVVVHTTEIYSDSQLSEVQIIF
ncbi:hypothetical protein H6H01_15000 [Nostoc calcicola FACHB-3891]|nr:hypothetical protein [Nostoc calcicola FACHB-3891]